jgi:hypothetical protein
MTKSHIYYSPPPFPPSAYVLYTGRLPMFCIPISFFRLKNLHGVTRGTAARLAVPTRSGTLFGSWGRGKEKNWRSGGPGSSWALPSATRSRPFSPRRGLQHYCTSGEYVSFPIRLWICAKVGKKLYRHSFLV